MVLGRQGFYDGQALRQAFPSVFTGIVEACVPLQHFQVRGLGACLCLDLPRDGWPMVRGESLAVCGACLTVAGFLGSAGESLPEGTASVRALFDLSRETLERTWFANLEPGMLLNLERALRMSDRLGGHLVSGHIDGLATLIAIADSGDGGRLLTFEVAPGLERYLLEKGSVTLDGVSLTVVSPRGRRFDVALIPHTLAATNLGRAQPGQRVNFEADLIGKWVERLHGPR